MKPRFPTVREAFERAGRHPIGRRITSKAAGRAALGAICALMLLGFVAAPMTIFGGVAMALICENAVGRVGGASMVAALSLIAVIVACASPGGEINVERLLWALGFLAAAAMPALAMLVGC